MYVWTAIELNQQLNGVEQRAKKLATSLNLDQTAFKLPLHVSLKISFFIKDEKANAVIEFLQNYFKEQKPFEIIPDNLEYENGIVWIRMNESEKLKKLHAELDELLLANFGVDKHEYDLNFKFHSTLFINVVPQLAKDIFNDLKAVCLPKKLIANTFIIGTSASGTAGTYAVTNTIKV